MFVYVVVDQGAVYNERMGFDAPRHPVIFHLSWLKAQNPIVDWRNHLITFSQTSSEVQAVSHVAVTTKKMVHSASKSSSSMKTTTD